MVRRRALVTALSLLAVLTGCNRADVQNPDVTLSQSAEALRQVNGYHVRVEAGKDRATAVLLDLDVRVPGAATGNLTLAGTTLQIRFAGDSLYGRGRAFAEGYYARRFPQPEIDGAIGDGWFKDFSGGGLPGSLTWVLDQLADPDAIAACLPSGHRGLRVSGTGRLGDQPIAVLADSAAGVSPSERYSIASNGAPYLLQLEQTAAGGTGASPDICHLGVGTRTTFSAFGDRVSMGLPGRYVDVATLSPAG